MRNIAHRGFSGKYPENTILAFEKAIKLNVDMIELDITFSKDKIPVVIHDDTLERTTNGKGKVKNTFFNKLKMLDAGSWMHRKFLGEKIPSLEEVLAIIKKSKVHLNIEIKSSAFEKKLSDSSIEAQTIRLIKKYKLFNQIVISSFEPKVLLRLRKLSAKIKLSLLIEPNFEKSKFNPISFVKEIRAASLNMHKSQVRTNIFKKAREEKIPILIYTVNTKKEMQKMTKLGVEGIFTNYPDKLIYK